MTKTSKADLSQSILTTRCKKEYLKTQASEKDAFFMSENESQIEVNWLNCYNKTYELTVRKIYDEQ